LLLKKETLIWRCLEQPRAILSTAILDVDIFGGSLAHSMFSMHLADSTNVNSSRSGEFDGKIVGVGIEGCKIVFLEGTSYSLVQTILL